ncbi:MAG: hypothetical protein ABJR46_14900 [Tateyamaria sp.]|uniref:hypothetical protein n=1 Tax=Tateyamaria sp. TaxID=1929288 RepID=UPI00329F10C9
MEIFALRKTPGARLEVFWDCRDTFRYSTVLDGILSMATTADLIMEYGTKAAQKLLSESLGKAAKYYETHINMLKDAYKAFTDDKEIKALVPKLKVQLSDISSECAAAMKGIPKKVDMPKKSAKTWGKSKKTKDYKEAMDFYMSGLGAVINELDALIKKAEKGHSQIEQLMKKLGAMVSSAKKRKGAWAHLKNISNQHAMAQLLDNERAMKASLDKNLSNLRQLRSTYNSALKAAIKVKV